MFRGIQGWYAAVAITIAATTSLQAAAITGQKYLEDDFTGGVGPDGRFVMEAEIHGSTTAEGGGGLHEWVYQDNLTFTTPGTFSNYRGAGYMRALPDHRIDATVPIPENAHTASGSENAAPQLNFVMQVQTAGTYRLYARFDNPLISPTADTIGFGDSFYAQLLDSSLTAVSNGGGSPDFYQYYKSSPYNGNFSDGTVWNGTAGRDLYTGAPTLVAATWVISTPGEYTLRLALREDGVGIDALVFQLDSLTAPTGAGPATSSFMPIPEPSTAGMLLLGGSAMVWIRRRKS